MEQEIGRWNQILVSAGVTVTEISRKLPSLEDLFIELTGDKALTNLVFNEMLKLTGKRRLLVIALILGILISVFTYAQYRQAEENRKRFGDVNWRVAMEQRIASWQNRITSSRTPEATRKELEIRMNQQKYYLEYNVNPSEPGAPTFVRGFVKSGINLLLPLMMMIIAADLVSSEHSAGTMKVLLTHSVRRWRILLSKYLALLLSVSLIITLFGLLSAVISGLVFGFQGWGLRFLPASRSMAGSWMHQECIWCRNGSIF